jgi:ferredoxin-NADP reductase
MTELALLVTEVQQLTPLIRAFRLQGADGGALPAFSAGAHLRFRLPLEGSDTVRQYSLIDPTGGAGEGSCDSYRIAVRLEEPGRGGSRYMHERVKVGDRLAAEGPINEFPLVDQSGRPVLIAGGIGITPLLTMAGALAGAGSDFRLHYSGRSVSQLAFVEELRKLAGERLIVHADDDPESRLDIEALLDSYQPTDPLYVCGPQGMLDAVLAAAKARGWPADYIHFELFSAPQANSSDHAFEVELRSSGITLLVPPDKTILEVLIEAGVDPLFDCGRGECGVCSATVLEGEVDHRDYYLSDAEKASNDVIQLCVSRAKSDRLVLDL